jgi:pre-mRNA-processing factor 6
MEERLGRPATPPTYLLQSLALLASRNGRPLEARAWFEKAVELDDDQPGVWESWGSMEARLGNREAAREYFQNALQGNTSRYAWLSWGRWETRWGEHQKGRDLLRIAHRRYPADTPIIQALALAEAKLGRAPEARRLFRRATRQDPLHLPSWQAWGVLEWQRGAPEQARELFQQGVWASPQAHGVVAIFKAWGDLEQSEGDAETARALYECALRVDGRSRRTWHALAELEEGEGNWQRAEEFRLLAAADAEAATPAPPSQGLRFLRQAESAGSSLGPVVRDFVERWQAALDEAPRPGQPPRGRRQGGGRDKALALNTR